MKTKKSKKVEIPNSTENTPINDNAIQQINDAIKLSGVEIHHLLILDSSGSMLDVKKETISGFNELVQTIKKAQRQFTTQKHFVSLTTFNDSVEEKLLAKEVASINELSDKDYNPDSGTALNDAIVMGISNLKEELEKRKVLDSAKVLVTILTDGEENSSKKYSQSDAAAKVKEMQDTYKWVVTFQGCSQDTLTTANSYGVSYGNTVTYASGASGTSDLNRMRGIATMAFCSNVANDCEDLNSSLYSDVDNKTEAESGTFTITNTTSTNTTLNQENK